MVEAADLKRELYKMSDNLAALLSFYGISPDKLDLVI